MTRCFFVSDLHGKADRYRKLFGAISAEAPQAVFLGGDLFPPALTVLGGTEPTVEDFPRDFLISAMRLLKTEMGDSYPRVFVILGNDDGFYPEPALRAAEEERIWDYVHMRKAAFGEFRVYGYSFIPPSPFLLKDWEKYDVSRFVDPGSLSPEEGKHSRPVDPAKLRHHTIKEDLDDLTADEDLERSIFLFHTPPYETNLDRAALDGKSIDHVPLDVHIGSIAVKRFIEDRQPLVTLHGHVHESGALSGSWQDRIGRTFAFSAAHDGAELALVRFTLEDLGSATRELM